MLPRSGPIRPGPSPFATVVPGSWLRASRWRGPSRCSGRSSASPASWRRSWNRGTCGSDWGGCSLGPRSRRTCGGRWKPRDKLTAMLGEQEAMVVEVKPFGLHGVTYYDVTVEFADRTVEQARLGPEGVPDGLRPGERVVATRAANMVISIRRL